MSRAGQAAGGRLALPCPCGLQFNVHVCRMVLINCCNPAAMISWQLLTCALYRSSHSSTACAKDRPGQQPWVSVTPCPWPMLPAHGLQLKRLQTGARAPQARTPKSPRCRMTRPRAWLTARIASWLYLHPHGSREPLKRHTERQPHSSHFQCRSNWQVWSRSTQGCDPAPSHHMVATPPPFTPAALRARPQAAPTPAWHTHHWSPDSRSTCPPLPPTPPLGASGRFFCALQASLSTSCFSRTRGSVLVA